MASAKNPKRARKKERRYARREEWRRAVQRRRRQRWGVLLGSLAVIGLGLAIAYFAFDRSPEDASPAAAEDDTVTSPVKEPVACGADVPTSAGSKKTIYSDAPTQKLDADKAHLLRLDTSCGTIDIELDVEGSPKTTSSVAFLARQKFYDGLMFHRINEGFVIQGGDPQGTGSGGIGYDVVEPPPEALKYRKGVVAMAKTPNDPPGTSGSQFFIVTGDEGDVLPPEYAYLGKVVDGMGVAAKIEKLGTGEDGPPSEWTYIERATIVEK